MIRRIPSGVCRLATVALLTVLIAACGGEDQIVGNVATVASVTVDPIAGRICTLAPGNSVMLTVTPRDATGKPVIATTSPSFNNSNPGIVAVASSGLVTAVAPGVAQVTASVNAGGTARTAVATITVASPLTGVALGTVSDNHPAPHSAALTETQLAAAAAVDLQIQGSAFHSHTLRLTSAHVMQIAAGCTTTVTSSADPHSDGTGTHSHRVTFN